MLPYGHHWIDKKDIDSLVKTLKSPFITQGPKVKEFEDKVKDYCKAKYAVAVSSGTAGLHAACFAAGLGPGDEVITTPITFVASCNAVLFRGGRPVFVDIRPDTCNLNPSRIEEKITKKTKAIMAIDFAGHPADLDELRKLCKKFNLLLIEDAAHSFGAEYKGKKIGSIADLTVFSFHPVKTITTGEGGMILTNNRNFYEKLVMFRNHGITRDRNLMIKDDGGWYYEMLELGNNYRLTDIQCALGLSQMNKLDNFLARRREIAAIYRESFKSTEEIVTPTELPYVKSAWHIYVIRLESHRQEIFNNLVGRGLGVNLHYIPVYLHPYYQKLGYKKGICPNAEEYYKQAITLPLYPKMTDSDVNFVIKNVKKVVSRNVKRA